MGTLLWILAGVVVAGAAIAVWRKKRQSVLVANQSLLRATENGDVSAMRELLAAGASVQARNDRGLTPLHIAAAGGDVAVVEALLQHGAEVNATSNIGTTPLYNATQFGGKEAVVELLLRHGADPASAWHATW